MQQSFGLESVGRVDDVGADGAPGGEPTPAGPAPRRRRSPGRGTRHSMVVLASDEVDLILSAGGLLVDRVMTGWRVTAHLESCRVERAVQILGTVAGDLSAATAYGGDDVWPDAIVASAPLVEGNPALRRFLLTAGRQAGTEVAFWGGDWPIDRQKGVGPVEHRLSLAARAFKSHALLAADVQTTGAVHLETFTSGRRQGGSAAPLTPPR